MRAYAFALMLALAGCATTEDFVLRCESYGFEYGTTKHAECVQREQVEYNRALRSLGQQLSASSEQPSNSPQVDMQCNSNCVFDLGYSAEYCRRACSY